jgi:hypothetical protein
MYQELRRVLRHYADILATWHDGHQRRGALTIVLTGSHPPTSLLMGETTRYAALDGVLSDIDSAVPPSVLPMISIDWRTQFHWKGVGDFDRAERAKLEELTDRAHARGRAIRFWAAPDQPRGWQELLCAGVDYINTDDLTGLRRFLLDRPTSQPCTRTTPAGSLPDPGNK